MRILQALSLVLILVGPALSRKVTSVKKDASEIKFVPTVPPEEGKDNHRISRQSGALYTPSENVKYQYTFVPVASHQHSAQEQEEPSGNEPQYITQQVQETYQNIPLKHQEQILAALSRAQSKQPKTPVYHATPLEPYGALLKEIPPANEKKYVEKTILVTPKAIVHQEEESDHVEGQSGGHSYFTSSNDVGKHTEAVIQEPKHAPLVYHHHHQTLHHNQEHEEPKSYAAKYQFGYQVRDPKHGTYFGHAEARDGHHTKGNYHVLLPDGRLQNVQYWADLSGYHAQISYNTAAKHPLIKHH